MSKHIPKQKMWVIFNKDIYTSEYLKSLDLSGRQIKAILYTKENGKITNSEYQKITDVSRETASRDLKQIVEKKLFIGSGSRGAGAFYKLT